MAGIRAPTRPGQGWFDGYERGSVPSARQAMAMSRPKPTSSSRRLLEGLRTTLPGVEVLFGFLLVFPLQANFSELRDYEKPLYVVALLCAAVALILFIVPSVHQRCEPIDGIPRHHVRHVKVGAYPRSVEASRHRLHSSRRPGSHSRSSTVPWRPCSSDCPSHCSRHGHGSGSRFARSPVTSRNRSHLASAL